MKAGLPRSPAFILSQRAPGDGGFRVDGTLVRF